MPTFQEHKVDWTPEKIQRFWEFQGKSLPDTAWFTHQVGEGIIRFITRHIKGHRRVLDYGTGRGFLTEKLLGQPNCEVYACDFVESLVRGVNSRFASRHNYRGCELVDEPPLPFADCYFDLVFLLETIEHLSDSHLLSTLRELHRITAPNGVIVVTTPAEENLKASETMCPDCGCIYHRVQHVRSFNSASLTQIMGHVGFLPRLCKAVNLEAYCTWQKYLYHWMKRRLGAPLPNLVYIGNKTSQPSTAPD